MVSATDTRTSDWPGGAVRRRLTIGWRVLRRSVRRFGWRGLSLSRRILFVNMLAVVLLGGGMLYLDRYERGLIDTELQALQIQGTIFAGALGEAAVPADLGDEPVLITSLARGLVERLTPPDGARARLFLSNGVLIADSRTLSGPAGAIQVEELPPPEQHANVLESIVSMFSALLPARNHYPPEPTAAGLHASDFVEVRHALNGAIASAVRVDKAKHSLVLSVAVPVRRYKEVLGAILLSTGSANLEHRVTSVRTDILRLFLFSLVFTSVLSLYLARTIARPLKRLAQAAREVRHGQGRQIVIPDFGTRHDEIGALASALHEMTQALWRRMDAIERFAADVAHEIKNPLSSLRSAVETAARVKESAQQQRLMGIILHDVQRLDRLISDISDASRLDAEMSRLERTTVPILGMLETLVDMHNATRHGDDPELVWLPRAPSALPDPMLVAGKETRLVQVFQNLLSNALSFSPPGGTVRLGARRQDGTIHVVVDDDGPGIPPGKLSAIFDRFYSERPAGEKFGMHSGLGLSISKQIVEAHGGTIRASNRSDPDGRVIGARFEVALPAIAPLG